MNSILDERIQRSREKFQQAKEERIASELAAKEEKKEQAKRGFMSILDTTLSSEVREALHPIIYTDLDATKVWAIIEYKGVSIHIAYNGGARWTMGDVTQPVAQEVIHYPCTLASENLEEGLMVYIGEAVARKEQAVQMEKERQQQVQDEYQRAAKRREEQRLHLEEVRAREAEDAAERERKRQEKVDAAIAALEPFEWPESKSIIFYAVHWFTGEGQFDTGYSLSDELSKNNYILLESQQEYATEETKPRRIKLEPALHLPIFTELTIASLDELPPELKVQRYVQPGNVWVDTVPVEWVRRLVESS